MRRRRFLHAAAGASVGLGASLLQGCAGDGDLPTAPGIPSPAPGNGPVDPDAILIPRVNGGLNVQPVRTLGDDPGAIEPDLVALQLQAVYELGFDAIRITAPHGDRANFLAAIPYVRGARALGIDVLVVVSSFAGFTAPRVLWDPEQRPDVMGLYNGIFAPAPSVVGQEDGPGPEEAGGIAFQILNEPTSFFGVPPDVYVREILGPAYIEQGQIDPLIPIVSAAPVGNRDGVPRVRAMLDAGLEDASDVIAYHVYDPAVIPLLSPNVGGFVWITESGVGDTALHLDWVRNTFEQIRRGIPDVARIFFFQLFDAQPGRFGLIDLEADADSYRAVVESTDLHAYLESRVLQAAEGAPLLPFETLIPDIQVYFPTPEDIEAHDEVLFG